MKEAIRVILLSAVVLLMFYFYTGAIKMNPQYYDILVDYLYRIVNPFH